MKRFLFLLLSLSLGLNAGLLYVRYVTEVHPRPLTGAPGPQGFHRSAPPPEVVIKEQLAAKTRHLGLSPAQQDTFEYIMEKHLPAMVELREKAQNSNRMMAEVYANVPFDEVEFLGLMSETSRARSRADSLSALILAEEASVLTDEQRRLFADESPMAQPEGDRPPPPRRQRF